MKSLDACLDDLLLSVGLFHSKNLEAVEEAANMRFEPEYGGLAICKLIAAYAFKAADAIMKGMGQNGDICIVPVN
jgi:hypothetical protein